MFITGYSCFSLLNWSPCAMTTGDRPKGDPHRIPNCAIGGISSFRDEIKYAQGNEDNEDKEQDKLVQEVLSYLSILFLKILKI